MSLKNIGNIVSSLSGGNDLKSLVDGIKELYSITSTMNVSAIGLNNVFNVFNKFNELEKGKQILKEVFLLMKSFDGSDESLVAISKAFDGISLESTKAILGISGLNKAQIETVLINAGLAPELAATTAAEISAGAGATGAAAGFKLLAASIKEALVGLVTFLLTNPVGWAILAVGAIAGVVAIVDKLTLSYDEAIDKAEESKKKFESLSSEISNLQSELDSLNEKKASITDESELATLESQTQELERQIALKQALADLAKKQASNDAENVLTMKGYQIKDGTETVTDYSTGTETTMTKYRSGTIVEYAQQKNEELKEANEKLEQAKSELDKLLNKNDLDISEGGFLGAGQGKDKAEYDRLTNIISNYESQVQSLNPIVQDAFGQIETQYESLEDKNSDLAVSCLDALNSFTDFASGVSNASESIEEIDYSNITEQQLNSLKETFKDNSIKTWFDSLSDDDKKLVYQIGVESDDTTLWTLTRWTSELDTLKDKQSEATVSMENLYSLMNDTENTGLSKRIESYKDTVASLQDLFNKVDLGQLTESDKVDMVLNFPQLAPYADDTNVLKDAIQNLIDTSNQGINEQIDEAIKQLGSDSPTAVEALEALRDIINDLTKTDGFNFNIDDEVTKFDNLYAAMKESVSATGLTTQSMKNVESMFKGLDNYDPSKLFERTANGIHMNTKELRNLQAEYEKQQKDKIDTHLQDLIKEYNDLGESIEGCTDASELASKVSRMDELQSEITNVSNLASQYEGLTSAYNKWIKAQSSGEEGDMYDSMRSSFDDVKKLYDEGLVGTNAFRTYVDLLSNQDLSTASVDEVVTAYKRLNKTIEGTSYTAIDFLADGSDGCLNFLHAVQDLNSDWAKMNKDGSWKINFGVGNDKEIADALGIDVEYVQSLMRKLSDFGFDINLDSAYTSMDKLGQYAEQAKQKLVGLQENGKIDIDVSDINLNVSTIEQAETEIQKAQELLNSFKNTDGTVDLSMEGAEEAQTMLVSLISKKQELSYPEVLKVDTSGADESVQNAMNLLTELQKNFNDLEIQTAIGADTTEAQTNIQNIVSELNGIEDTDIRTALNLDDAEFQNAISTITSTEVDVQAKVNIDSSAIDTIQSKIAGINANVITTFGTDTTAVDKETAKTDGGKRTTIFVPDTKAIDRVNAVTNGGRRTVNYYADTSSLPTSFKSLTRYVNYVATGATSSKGTAHAQGTAFAKGIWGAKGSGVALVGEVGQELVVRDGKFFTIGDDGAEFFKYQDGDVIFNAGQASQIFKYGKIKNGKKRGEVFANGTAFAEGTAFSNGSGKITGGGKSKTTSKKKSTSSNSKGSSKGSSKSSSSSSSNSSSEKDFEETFDWIEIAIDRVERVIDNLDLKAKSVYKSWSSRNKNLKNEISKITNEINIQSKGYTRYMKQAKSVGLSEKWAKKVRNGTIDISTIKDEDLANKIKEYQEWYEKALDCKYAVDELKESQADLYKEAFDNVATQYDGILQVIDYQKSMIDEFISQTEEKGYITSTKYYQAMIKQEQANIAQLNKEKKALLNSLEEGMVSGLIAKGSEAWYEMCNQIDDVTLAIEQANTALIKYNNSIRDIQWQIFDLLQERISYITSEADFLVNLLSNNKLYDDRGQLTSEGMSTMGLHGMNYNVYMAQADKYAEEMKKVSKELAKDPNNLDLAKRRQELLELQQEMILAAEDEKEAIRDMVSEGIERELDALKDLIDTYKDALDSQKDLYDYQKKVKDQTKEIASLQKQLSAYEGDTSEENRTRIQKIQVALTDAKEDLQETEYDKYISDQKKLLDDLYNEYETILNARLDNLDVLVSDMIETINTNSTTISTTLSDKVESVGYTLSDSMKTIWDTNSTEVTDVLTTYGNNLVNGIASATTTVNNALNAINTNISNMIASVDKIANTKTTSVTTANSSTSSATKSTAANSTKTTTNNKATATNNKSTNSTAKKTKTKKTKTKKTSNSSSNSGWGSWFVKKNDSTPKSKLDKNNSIVDRLKYFNFDSSFNRRKTYYSKMGGSGTYTGSAKQNTWMINQMKSHGYKNGVFNLSKDEWAWTQEGRKPEAIIRPSDGAILTPLAKKDAVLNEGATSNIWNVANNPEQFIKDNLALNPVATPNIQNIHDMGDSNSFNFESVNFNLPNVMNYQELFYAMQHDKGFEKLVRAMTVDKMFGGSSLRKYK